MKDSVREGYAKLLDAWVAPNGAGEPVGCLATSFTFQPAFFEEECLARFLDIQSDPNEDGPIYLVEREEKLAGASCAALVDARHCRGSRSLRWDMLAARVPGGAMHAKISLLCWQRRVRLIVASANLTEDGYRRNQEVFGVLDFHEGSALPLDCLEEVTEFLGEITRHAGGEGHGGPALERWRSVLARAREIGAGSGGRSGQPNVRAVLTDQGRPSAFERLADIWPGRSPPNTAHVVSPFFDPGPKNAPARALWKLLRRRGAAEITYHITAAEAEAEGMVVVHAPESLRHATPSQRAEVECRFARIREDRLAEKEALGFRPLHAKTLWLDDGDTVCSMVGSSNFTSSGLGLAMSPNVEANLAYCASRERSPKVVRVLGSAQLRGDALDSSKIEYWQAREDETEQEDVELPSLPDAFREATLSLSDDGTYLLKLTIEGTPPSGWEVFREDRSDPLYSEDAWQTAGQPTDICLELESGPPPAGLEVDWEEAEARAWWSVNVADATALPPPAELRDLSLDALIHILTSARPLKDALRTWLRRKQAAEKLGDRQPEEIDPHKRVDTSRFLLQRTRRMSWAMAGLRERLQRPVPTLHALRWRLYGPVGVERIAEALEREKRSEEEYAFLLAELALELSRVEPVEAQGCLGRREIRAELQLVARRLTVDLERSLSAAAPATRNYIEQVLRHIATEFSSA